MFPSLVDFANIYFLVQVNEKRYKDAHQNSSLFKSEKVMIFVKKETDIEKVWTTYQKWLSKQDRTFVDTTKRMKDTDKIR